MTKVPMFIMTAVYSEYIKRCDIYQVINMIDTWCIQRQNFLDIFIKLF